MPGTAHEVGRRREKSRVRKLARALQSRGGGPPTVQRKNGMRSRPISQARKGLLPVLDAPATCTKNASGRKLRST